MSNKISVANDQLQYYQSLSINDTGLLFLDSLAHYKQFPCAPRDTAVFRVLLELGRIIG